MTANNASTVVQYMYSASGLQLLTWNMYTVQMQINHGKSLN